MDSRLSQETPISKEAVTFWDLFYTYPPRSHRNFLTVANFDYTDRIFTLDASREKAPSYHF